MKTQKTPIDLAIVMPVYEDREAVQMLLKDLKAVLTTDYCVFAIEDGSLNNPLRQMDFENIHVKGEIIRLTRNMGHQRAIAVGLNYLVENYTPTHVVVMDSDGEDKPDCIPKLLAEFDDTVDVVVASRKSRQETLKFKTFYIFYKLIFSLLTGRKVSFGNFMAFSNVGLNRIVAMNELWLHFAAAVILSRLRIKDLPLDRGARYSGQSKMNFSGLVLHGMRAVMVFTEDVLVRVGTACVLFVSLVIFMIGVATLLKLHGMASPGWFTSAIGILFVIGSQAGLLILFLLLINGSAKTKAPIKVSTVNPLIDSVDMIS